MRSRSSSTGQKNLRPESELTQDRRKGLGLSLANTSRPLHRASTDLWRARPRLLRRSELSGLDGPVSSFEPGPIQRTMVDSHSMGRVCRSLKANAIELRSSSDTGLGRPSRRKIARLKSATGERKRLRPGGRRVARGWRLSLLFPVFLPRNLRLANVHPN